MRVKTRVRRTSVCLSGLNRKQPKSFSYPLIVQWVGVEQLWLGFEDRSCEGSPAGNVQIPSETLALHGL